MNKILLTLSFSIALFANETPQTQTNQIKDGLTTKAVSKSLAREEKLVKRALERETKEKQREAKIKKLHLRLNAEDSDDNCE